MPVLAHATVIRQRLLCLAVILPVSACQWALLPAGAVAAVPQTGQTQPAARAEPVQFNRDIRPILSDACFQCHGPDSVQRKAGLRLDTREGLLGDGEGKGTVRQGQPHESELFQRVTAKDADLRMPPPGSGKKLTQQQIDLLGRWIRQGAPWQKHWSFLPVTRPQPPRVEPVEHRETPRNEIDQFVLARLQNEGLKPAPPASRETLIRRVTLDLTGLPPTPEEVDAFLADDSPEAWDRVIDRLFASPRYGERMATVWLDAARYADTNGYQTDAERYMWRWRDWVIESFNANQPFDEFTIEQLAGDLLPEPTLAQRIATGFNRNHRGNGEGGIIAEEYAVEYVVDRVETTSTVWMGLTLGCARCHDHKFDPFSQKNFYELYAFFNSIPENGRANKYGNSPPEVRAPTDEQQAQLEILEEGLRSLRAQFASQQPRLNEARAVWEAEARKNAAGNPAPRKNRLLDWTFTRGLESHLLLDGELRDLADDDKKRCGKPAEGEAVFAAGPPVPGDRETQSLQLDGSQVIEVGDVGGFGFYDRFTFSAWILPENPDAGIILSRMEDANLDESKGYQLRLRNGHLEADFVVRWLDDALRVHSRDPLPAEGWQHVAVSYDGSRLASGVQLYVNGQPVPLVADIDELNQPFDSTEPLRVGGGPAAEARFHGQLADVRVYSRLLTPADVQIVATPGQIDELAAISPEDRTAPQQAKLDRWFVEAAAPPEIVLLQKKLTDLTEKRDELIHSLPTVMVMQELPEPRPAHVLLRGEYNQPGEQVSRAVPAALPPLPAGVPRNRLGLAKWLVHRDHPLTSRVMVNRLWALCFGYGLVRTPEDFGSQGSQPAHPELLDWLAVEFMEPAGPDATPWDVQRMLRLIVSSATYRQSSRITPQLAERDPNNQLLARGPRYRLPAEMIRDQALAASGLLVEEVGGPSVKPYQPAGLWEEVSGQKYEPGTGDDLYRRSLYTFFKRTVAPPLLSGFDAAGRETCTVERTRTNTPLQALSLMNSTTFVEAARVLAARVLAARVLAARVLQPKEETPAERLTHMFRLVTGRRPAEAELAVLKAGLKQHLAHFREHPDQARKLMTTGESPPAEKLDPAEVAAYATLGGLLFNLDEAVTKE